MTFQEKIKVEKFKVIDGIDAMLCIDFLKVLSNNSSLGCWFRRWKGLFPPAARQILPVDLSPGDVNTH